MDPASVIVADTIGRLADSANKLLGAFSPAAEEAALAVSGAVGPVVEGCVAGITAVQNACGPNIFFALLLFCGAFAALAIGSAMRVRHA